MTHTERLAQMDAASALYGSAKRWVIASLVGYVGMIAAGSVFGDGEHRWVTGCLFMVGAGCMWRGAQLIRRAGKLLKVIP